MTTWSRRTIPSLLLLFVAAGVPGLHAQDHPPLDHEVYEIWRTIGNRAISADGRWVHYTLELEDGDGELVVRHVDSDREHRVARGAAPRFARDGSHVVFLIRPQVEAVREARRDRNGGEAPRDSLGILELATGDVIRVADVRGFRLPGRGGGWVAYHLHPERPGEGEPEDPGKPEDEAEDERAASSRAPLVLRELATGEERRFADVSTYAWAEEGGLLGFVVEPPDGGDPPGVRAVRPGEADVTVVMEADGRYLELAADREGTALAFLHAPPAEEDRPELWALHHWRTGDAPSRAVAWAGEPGLPEGWEVSRHVSVRFSPSGARLFFGSAPRQDPSDSDRFHLETEVEVEIWHWRDPDLMTVQNVRAERDRERSYTAVVHLDEERIVQLADEEVPALVLHDEGDGDLAVGRSSLPYRMLVSWDFPSYEDVYVVDLRDGSRRLAVEATQGSPSLSPDARYLTWYEPADSAWFAHEAAGGEVREISGGIPHPVWDEGHDRPFPAGPHGSGGWTEGDERFLVYDAYDVWAVDPSGANEPRSVTGGTGRERALRYRVVRPDREREAFARDESILLLVIDERTRETGFSRASLRGDRAPERLVLEPRIFSSPVKADEDERLLFTAESFREFPDLWVSGPDLRNRTRVSDANPQQADYRWGTAELVAWTSTDGIPLDGILMKPDDFDPERAYPMVVYFYELWSDGLHRHYAPVPHRSTINFPMYTSHDYLVFIPDIRYRTGYPGESALNAVVPGVLKLLDEGFVDRDRIGLQGHSWGGYQIAFIVTRSRDLFRAAAAGAPVSNMTSAYGGIRWDTGLVRQFQYERTQSRLGGSLWEVPLRYIENSPLFWTDKIETPLLIMHNDRDGAVPWEQGIEFFVALRRLGKPAWLVNYNDEPHWPTSFPNRRDWNIRMKQFFDHFLKDAPPPVWMVEGIPAVRKGETLGLELVEGASAVEGDR
jgi:dipeptidyl aminopeptidase/acylaminoacyl peptidase